MAQLAVLYDTTEGQTAKIARKIAEVATSAGHEVTTLVHASFAPFGTS